MMDMDERYEAYDKKYPEGICQALQDARAWIGGELVDLQNEMEIDRRRRHEVAIVVDRVVIRQDSRSRLTEAVETALSADHSDHRVLVEFFPPSDDQQADDIYPAVL